MGSRFPKRPSLEGMTRDRDGDEHSLNRFCHTGNLGKSQNVKPFKIYRASFKGSLGESRLCILRRAIVVGSRC